MKKWYAVAQDKVKMQVPVNISQPVLQWVFTQIKFEKLSSEIQKYLNWWKNGEKTPTLSQVEKVSKATYIPLGYFFSKNPPKEDLSIVEYRTVDSKELQNPSRELIDILYYMRKTQNWMRDYLTSEGLEKLRFVGMLTKNCPVTEFALEVRNLLGIAPNWYKNTHNSGESFNQLREAISNAGVIVMRNGIVGYNTHRPLNIDEFRAFSLIDPYAPLIFINSNDSNNGELFSLLHEFAHVCIGQSSLFNASDSINVTSKIVSKTETLCNAVAAEILVPQEIFVANWNEAIKKHANNVEQSIQDLAKEFRSGVTVIARKAYDNNFIDYPLYQRIAQQAISAYNASRLANKTQHKGGGNFYRNAAKKYDRRFFLMLINSIQEGKTLHTEAFRLTQTNDSTFDKIVDVIKGGL